MYGVHSWRVGGDNAHKKSCTLKQVRKEIGHWTSNEIGSCSRAELELLAHYVKGQDIDRGLLQIRDPDMQMYPETQHLKIPGEVSFRPDSEQVDPDLAFGALKLSVAAVPTSFAGRTMLFFFRGTVLVTES